MAWGGPQWTLKCTPPLWLFSEIKIICRIGGSSNYNFWHWNKLRCLAAETQQALPFSDVMRTRKGFFCVWLFVKTLYCDHTNKTYLIPEIHRNMQTNLINQIIKKLFLFYEKLRQPICIFTLIFCLPSSSSEGLACSHQHALSLLVLWIPLEYKLHNSRDLISFTAITPTKV